MTPRSAWLLLVASLTCCHRLRGAGAGFCDFTDSYPRQLVAVRAGTPPVIDGRLDEPVWEEVEWSESFVDISGAAPPRFSTRAKVRWDDEWLYVGALLSEPDTWANNTEHDAVRNHGGDRRAAERPGAAILISCLGLPLRQQSQHPQVIFNDNDFEVFVDADGSTHSYKARRLLRAAAHCCRPVLPAATGMTGWYAGQEVEVNANAATWDLCARPCLCGVMRSSLRAPERSPTHAPAPGA